MPEINILLVDDKKENLLALSTLLEKEGRRILTTQTGDEALRLALEYEFALILLDVQMPGMDGYEVASILQSNKKTSRIPILFVTAISSDDTNILKGFETGAVDFLFKPLNHDITRAKVDSFIRLYEQQRQLEEKNRKLQELNTMVQHSHSGMCMVEIRRFSISGMNPAFQRIFGLQEEENIQFLDLFTDEEQPEIKEQFLKNKKAGHSFSKEAGFTRPDQTKGYLHLSVASNGEFWFVSLIDITEKKAAEEHMIRSYLDLEEKVRERTTELMTANNEMQEFVRAVSHDLRAPLRGISSLATWIAEDCEGVIGEKGVDNLTLLKRRVEKLDNMIKSVVEYSRIGRTVVSHDQVDLKQVLNGVIKKMKIPPHVKIKLQKDLPQVRFNKEFLQEVFQELISNAARFADSEAGQVEISAVSRDQEWEVIVKDNGQGIPKKYLNEIFKVFYAIHQGEQDVKHVGMGLAHVKKIIGLKNGRIWAESKSGKGTEIHFTIPREPNLTTVVS